MKTFQEIEIKEEKNLIMKCKFMMIVNETHKHKHTHNIDIKMETLWTLPQEKRRI